MTTDSTPLKFFAAVLCASIVGGAPPALGASENALHLRYQAMWSGLHVADFTLSLQNDGETYENRFRLETRGITRFFSNMSVKANSTGRIVAPATAETTGQETQNAAADLPQAETYLANSYRTEYTNHKHFRWVDIAFKAPPDPAEATTGTAPVEGREDKWDPKDKGPELIDRVEPKDRIGVNDPISLIPQMIAVVRTHLDGGPKTGVVRGFDGRRRFDMHITYVGPATRTIGEAKQKTYHVRIDPNPVAGFKKRHKTIWTGAAYDFYLSSDGRFVPLQIYPVKRGPVLTLVAECPTACELKAEED